MSKQINCNEPDCWNHGGYARKCGHSEAVIEQPQPISKVSEKRDKINRKEYYPEAKKFVGVNQPCEMNLEGCTGIAQCVHHTKGKATIPLLLDKRWWKRSCYACNLAAEIKDAIARGMNLKLSKFNEKETNA
jgi:hypothetical protein